jgi:hypothetical protein
MEQQQQAAVQQMGTHSSAAATMRRQPSPWRQQLQVAAATGTHALPAVACQATPVWCGCATRCSSSSLLVLLAAIVLLIELALQGPSCWPFKGQVGGYT